MHDNIIAVENHECDYVAPATHIAKKRLRRKSPETIEDDDIARHTAEGKSPAQLANIRTERQVKLFEEFVKGMRFMYHFHRLNNNKLDRTLRSIFIEALRHIVHSELYSSSG